MKPDSSTINPTHFPSSRDATLVAASVWAMKDKNKDTKQTNFSCNPAAALPFPAAALALTGVNIRDLFSLLRLVCVWIALQAASERILQR